MERAQVAVDKTGFSFYGYSNSFPTTTFSSPTNVRLTTVLINPTTGNIDQYGYLINPGLSVTVPLTNSNSNTGTIASSVVFNAPDSSESTNFTPLAAGTTTISGRDGACRICHSVADPVPADRCDSHGTGDLPG